MQIPPLPHLYLNKKFSNCPETNPADRLLTDEINRQNLLQKEKCNFILPKSSTLLGENEIHAIRT